MLLIQITKRTDGSGVRRCVREDGSATWQKQTANAAFFALHDLTHFAVESTLGFQRGFFGLIASGWDVDDTTGKGSRGPLPDEALEVEHIVGVLDSERACGETWSAADFNTHAAIHAASAGKGPPRVLTDDELRTVRARRAELFSKWLASPPGAAIELKWGS